MAHPQDTPRGFLAKQRIDVAGSSLTANSTGLKLSAGLYLSGEATDVITQDSTAVKLASGLALSGQASSLAITQDANNVIVPGGVELGGTGGKSVRANSTAYLFNTTVGAPVADGGLYKWHFVLSAGGTASIAVNTTATTWKYTRMTATINTT